MDDAKDEAKWDSSSRVGGSEAAGGSQSGATPASKLRAAEEFLLENRELKSVHSNASVRAMLVKSEKMASQSPGAVGSDLIGAAVAAI
jgi:hypothetical protein